MASQENQLEQFESGATRNLSKEKFDYEGFLHPVVLHEFGRFMHENRFQKDGSVRASDNWQEGIPFDNYMKSLLRHVFELWYFHRTGIAPFDKDRGVYFTRKNLLTAIMFNTMGYLKELLMPTKINLTRQTIYQFDEQETESKNNGISKGQGLGTFAAAGGGIAGQTGSMAQGRREDIGSVLKVRHEQEDSRRSDLSGLQETYRFPRR